MRFYGERGSGRYVFFRATWQMLVAVVCFLLAQASMIDGYMIAMLCFGALMGWFIFLAFGNIRLNFRFVRGWFRLRWCRS